ncbi:protein-L-isoaspartate O-methyltransferase family protein [Rhizobium beringeri]|uniref:protein-L-isoaspartate O-methyltransferase family protein n=1 Tax=Rhizobium beringeri TaxID=3019934 RepID=UPI001FE1D735|nr:methyltransferase domain-containing protein [Rhizobium beringeri]
MTPDELKIVRRAYAKQITAAVRVVDERVETAFAEVPREDFLGHGPWPIFRMRKAYVPTPAADPVYLYTDDIVGIVPERHINNGQPSLHAFLLSQAAPRAGEHIVHVGAGAGYYSAIMAKLVAASGKVTAIEFEPELAARAKANLTAYRNVSVVPGDGSSVAFDAADVIYVMLEQPDRRISGWTGSMMAEGLSYRLRPILGLPAAIGATCTFAERCSS